MADSTDERLPDLPRLHPVVVAAALGAMWGAAGYAVLWGLTPWGVSRSFVLSLVGSLALLPVRLVLGSIRLAERVAGRAFHFPDSNWWIGLLAALVGAGIGALATALALLAVRRLRASRSGS